ncbi:MAG: septum formation initiator [Alphaproteobacteria bacterium]|nr:septum formation initiator [Alphaproteobacteria bacterium]MBV9374763.1 septum formation initiator [Alphaproteobacteria bacterium]
MRKSIAVVLLSLVAFAAAPGAQADDKPNGELPARVATHHTMGLDGRRLDYEAVAETLPVTDGKGNTTASIFTVSYVTDGENGGGSRPVSFVFNGGPGAASVFLHLGALGPQILETPENGAAPTPPVRLVDNPSTWLGFSDLVFVDPVGTGFSRGKGKEDNPDKPFWDVHSDIASLGSVVRLWLTRHQRWTSPVYLVGESYGGFRAAAMAQTLPHDVNVIVRGLVLVSPALDLSALHQTERDLLASAFALPSYAATAAAYGMTSGSAGIEEAERFALSDYLVGLAGLKGQPSVGDPFIARIAQIAGLPAEIVRRYRGRIPRHIFAREIRRNQGEVVSLYDSMIARPAGPEDSERGGAGDPVLQPAVAAYGTAFNAYLVEALGIHTNQPYRVLPHDVSQQWNWQGEGARGSDGLAMSSLEAALLEHPAMKVLIASGRYDLVTPYFSSRWLVDQLEIPEATRSAIQLRVYDGGHMLYMRPASRALLARDAAEVYGAGEPGAVSQ